MEILRADDIQDSNIFNQLDTKKQELEKKGVDVINLSIGTPDFHPPKHIMEAVSKAALDPLQYRYSLTETRELLSAVQQWYQKRYHVDLSDKEIMSAAGSQEGIAHICFAFAGRGDLILAPNPGYPIFSFGPMMTGAAVGLYPLREEHNWVLNFADIPDAMAEKAKAIIVSYPNNPTAAVADVSFYEELIVFAKKHDLIVIHDNAYSDLMLDGDDGISFLSVPGAREVGVEFNSLSKTYNVTGMRMSFVVGNAEVIRRFRAFRSQIDYGAFYPVQAGAVAALTGPQDVIQQNRDSYRQRRDALCSGLREIGWDIADPKGTMFVWAKIPTHFSSAVDFSIELMDKTGIICVPGDSFGSLGRGYVRFALVVPPERMRMAVKRIADSGILEC